MSTGNLTGNVARLADNLRAVRYPLPVTARALREGEASTLLPILHFVLLEYSTYVAAFLHERGIRLFGKDDRSFADEVFRLATMHWRLHPHITAAQFLSRGFAERKLLLVIDMIRQARSIHNEALRLDVSRRSTLPFSR